MEWLNYHHLLYFWTVAKEGSISRACEKLLLAQPTISGQLRLLEESIGEKLFKKAGRGLALTEVGQVVFQYADEIFGIGRELQDVIKGRPRGRPIKVKVGVSDQLPKLIAYRILQPTLKISERVQLTCHEDTAERLLAELVEHRLDVVLSDAPITTAVGVKAFNHLLGTSDSALFGSPKLAARYRKGFPKCLDGAPFLLPLEGCTLRRSLDQYFDAHNIRPSIVGEFKDSALLKTFGEAGAGLFAGPATIAKEIKRQYGAVMIGQLEGIVERFYAISLERRLKNPAVVAISESAHSALSEARNSGNANR
jgi:LysR family transcriptional activator of nhaA